MEDFDINNDTFAVSRKVKTDLNDIDFLGWKQQFEANKEVMDLLISMINDITSEYDENLYSLEKLDRQQNEKFDQSRK